MENKLISIIIPCYNEEKVINFTHDKIVETFKNSPYQIELIYIDDGSADNTFALLKTIQKNNSCVRIIHFSRNFGHQMAISAGMEHSAGDSIITIDADLQDPPYVMLDMIRKWEEGYDIVYGKRFKRDKETAFKLITAKYFYRLINKISETNIPLDVGDFRLMDRNAVNQFIRLQEKHRFIRGMVSWIGFNQTFVEYHREGRFAGETKYPLKKMIRLALDAIFSFSSLPLKVASYIGFFIFIISIIGILYALILRIFTNEWITGWTLMFIMMLFMGGATLLVLGIMGEYIARIYTELKNRPIYIIKDKLGYNEK